MIAVTGATGHSGGYFVEELIRNEYPDRVRFLVRSTSNTERIDGSHLDFEKVMPDLKDVDSLADAFSGVDTVLHITGIRYSPYIVEAAVRQGVCRVILVHTTGIFSKYKMASDEYKEVEAQLEGYKDKIQIVILQPTMIFGDLCDHNVSKFIRMVDRFPIMPVVGKGKNLIQPVNARDLAKGYYQVLTSDVPPGHYVLSGEQEICMSDFYAKIAEYLGKKYRKVSFSLGLCAFAARVLKICSLGKVDYVERVLRMGENRNFSHEKASEAFGYAPEPFLIGLKREVEQYKAARD